MLFAKARRARRNPCSKRAARRGRFAVPWLIALAMGLVVGEAGAQDPQRRHNLDELASRGGDKPWVRLYADGQFPTERTIFRDSLTGAETWRLTDDSREDRHDLHDIPAWNADGTAMIVVRSSGIVPEDMWLISADASSVRPIANFALEHLLDPQLPVDTAARQSFWSWADPGQIYSLANGVVSLIDPLDFAKIEIFDLMTSPVIDNPDLPILESTDFVLVPPHPRDDRLLFHTASKGRLFTLDLVTLELFEIPTDGRWEMPDDGETEAGLQHLRWTREPDQSRLFIGQDARVENGEVIPDSTQYIATLDGSLTDYNLEGFTQRAGHPDLTMTGSAFTGCYDNSIWAVGIDGRTLDRRVYSAETTQHHPSSTWDDRWLATDNGLYQGSASPVDLRGFDVEQSIVLMSPDGRSQNVLNYHHSSYTLDESTHPAPTSSPDGTKIAFDSDMLDRAVGDGGDGDGNPDLWLVVARPPAQPRSVRVRPQGGGIRVSWKRPLHAGEEIYWNPGNLSRETAGYNVFRAPASGGPYEQLNEALLTSTSYDDTDVEPGFDYYYVTQSVEHSGLASVYSREGYASTTSRRWNGDVLHFYEAEHAELTLPMVPQFAPETSSGDWFVGTFARVPDPAYPLEPGPAAVAFNIAPPKGGRYDLWVKLKGFEFGGTVDVEVDGVAQASSLIVEPGEWRWVVLPTTVRLRGRSSVIQLSTQDNEIGIDMLALRLGAQSEPPAFGNRDITAPAPPSDPRLVSIDGNTKQVIWSASPDKDVRHYNVYCGRDATYPLGNENLLRSPQATATFDWGIPSGFSTVYKITAVDRYGNESEPIVFDPGSEGEESAPEALDDAWSVDQGGTLVVPPLGVLANDVDTDGDALTASLVRGVDHGVLALLDDGSFHYTPDPVFSGEDRFTYLAGDDVSTSNIATVTITIVGILGGPVANDDVYSTSEDVDLAVPAAAGVLANDISDEGKALTAILVTPTQHGSIALSPSGEVDYQPHGDFNGADSFTYKASDGNKESNTATVNLTVQPAQDPPVAAADAYAVDQDQVLDILAPGVLANDHDSDGDTLQAQLAANPANGTLVLRLNGSFTYTPDAGFSGTDAFTYTATDGIDTSPPVTVQIDIQRVDQQADYYVSPSGNDSTGDGSEGKPWKTIQKALDTLVAGETVQLRGGEHPGVFGGWVFANSGTQESPITISNYPGEQAVLRVLEGDTSGMFRCWTTLWITPKADHVRVVGTDVTPRQLSNGVLSSKGIVLQGPSAQNPTDVPAFTAAGCDYWEIAGVDFVDVGYAIFQHKRIDQPVAPESQSADYWYVHDNRVIGFYGESGMQFNGDYNTVESNEILKVYDFGVTPWGCQLLNIVGHHSLVRGNLLDQAGSTMACNGILLEWDLSDFGVFDGNTILDTDMPIHLFGGDNNIFRNNVIATTSSPSFTGGFYISSGPGDSHCNTEPDVIRPPNDPDHPDYPYYYEPRNCESWGNQIINNTVHGYVEGIRFYPEAPVTTIRNNALSGWSRGAICFYESSTGNCKTLPGQVSADHNIETGDFGFESSGTYDFHLKATSPLVDAGADLGALVVDDFDGVSRPQGLEFDIGAFERPVQ